MKKKRRSGFLKRFLIFLIIVLVIALAAFCVSLYIKAHYTVKTAVVEGNTHYTDEEIRELVCAGKYGNNSLYLSHKYKNREIEDVPFIQTINVKIVDNETIRISVYEKALAGYIEYLGRYIYFDKDGIAVESALTKTKGVPEVVGVDFDYVVLYEQLPAKDDTLFRNVLTITQLMTKYDVFAEKMYFAPEGNIVLYKDDITINLGKSDNIDIKIMNLNSILSKLEGMSGTLRMENYDEGTKRISFEKSND